jgi:predicted phage-related endonuclease
MLSPEQIEARRTGIGGSEVAALLGLHPFIGPLDVYLSKVEGYSPPSNTDMERGSFLEDGIARWYAHRECEGRELIGSPDLPMGPWVHPREPIFRCTPDRLVDLGGDAMRLLSIKCPRRAGDEWGEPGGSTVPTYAVLQLQWEDYVGCALGKPLDPQADLAALVEGDLRTYHVRRDTELQGWLVTKVRQWWAEHVEPQVPPPVDGSPGASLWLRRRFPRNTRSMVQASLEDDGLLLDLREQERALETVEKAYALARQRVEERIGEAEGITGPLGTVTWRANKKGVRSFKPRWVDAE